MLVTSFTKHRRSATIGAIAGIGLVLGLVAGFATYFGLSFERIRHYAVDVAVQPDGSALVRETIDYDFGNNSRHGILRDFPGYGVPGGDEQDVVSDVRVRSASAPAGFELTDDVYAEIRVGDPVTEVSGLHRYVLEYRITGATSGDLFGFDMIGTGWDVPIDEADLRVTAPNRLTGVGCYRGSASSETPCETSDGDVVTAHVEDLDEGQGVTIDGTLSGALSGPVRTALPDDVELTGGRSYWTVIWSVLGIGGAAFVLGIVPPLLWARRRGRDRAWAGGGIDAVFGGPGMAAAPIDDMTAERQVTMQFEPPRDLTPAQGGVLLHEKAEKHHQVAWLTQQSLDGWFAIENDGKRLRWTAADDRWSSAPAPLRTMFNRRAKVSLGKYDKRFAEGFAMVARELKEWRDTCELWDHAAETRNRRVASWVQTLAVLAALAGVIGLFWTATSGVTALLYTMAAASGFLVGAGVSMMMNAGELPIRTPEGFARRQLVEGFRRFFSASEGKHARAAAERGELRLYSAWAVALGELDRWNAAMSEAALPPSTSGVLETAGYVALTSTVSTATTAPASSSSSGGGYSGGGYSGGGSVGGGGGGGGGGSW